MSLPKISDAEWRVMKVVWSRSEATTAEVIEDLSGSTSWKPKTIMTMLRRLTDKGALSFKRDGRAFIYYPLVTEAACRKAESRSFLRRVSSGSLTPILASFVEEVDLSDQEITELKQLLDKKQSRKRKR